MARSIGRRAPNVGPRYPKPRVALPERSGACPKGRAALPDFSGPAARLFGSAGPTFRVWPPERSGPPARGVGSADPTRWVRGPRLQNKPRVGRPKVLPETSGRVTTPSGWVLLGALPTGSCGWLRSKCQNGLPLPSEPSWINGLLCATDRCRSCFWGLWKVASRGFDSGNVSCRK